MIWHHCIYCVHSVAKAIVPDSKIRYFQIIVFLFRRSRLLKHNLLLYHFLISPGEIGCVDLDDDDDDDDADDTDDQMAGVEVLGEGHHGCLACKWGDKIMGLRLRKGACTNQHCNLQVP